MIGPLPYSGDVSDSGPITQHRAERVLAFMFVGIVGVSILAFIAVMIGTLRGPARRRLQPGRLADRPHAAAVRTADRVPAPHRPDHRERRSPSPRLAGRVELTAADARARRTTPRAAATRTRVGACSRASSMRSACATSSTSPRCSSRPTPSTTCMSRLDRRHLAVLAAARPSPTSTATPRPTRCQAELVTLGASAELSDATTALLGGLGTALLVVARPTGASTCPPRVRRGSPRTRRATSRPRPSSPHPHLPCSSARRGRPQPARARAAETAYATVAATAELLAELGTPAGPRTRQGRARTARLEATRRVERHRRSKNCPASSTAPTRPAWSCATARSGSSPTSARSGRSRARPPGGAGSPSAGATAFPRRCANSSRAAARRSPRPTCATTCAGSTRQAAGGSTRASTGCVGDAEALGLAVSGEPIEAGRLVLAGDIDRAPRMLAAHFPTQVDKVYLQHDSRSCRRGPSSPRSTRGSAGSPTSRAATSPRPIASARHPSIAGWRPANRPRRSSSSSVGSRSPVSAAPRVPRRRGRRRFGSVRVAAADESEAPASAAIRSDDEQSCARSRSTSRSVPRAAPVRAPPAALQIQPRRRVLGALRCAVPRRRRRPDGDIVRLRRHRLAPAPPPPPKADPIAALLDRVLGTGDEATEQAWLARQLEAAARAKETLTVTVRMPGGQTADYLLAPASVANGRLRARDRKADIERTLPLSAIAAGLGRPDERLSRARMPRASRRTDGRDGHRRRLAAKAETAFAP